MKVLAAVATLAMAVAIGANEPRAAEKTARLYDPALTGEVRSAQPDVAETDPVSPLSDRTGLSSIERGLIHEALRGHIRALARRDANQLFLTLAPMTQEHYGEPGSFLHALDKDLKPVTQARSFSFSVIEREAEDALQTVIITDVSGRVWQAAYRLQRQGDGSWAISGCLVEPLAGAGV